MSDDNKRQLPEAGGRQFAETTIGLALAAVGLCGVRETSKSLLQIRDERLLRTYLENVANFMDEGSWERARDYIRNRAGEAWAQEGTARATRAILEGVDDDAARCIAALAASYYRRESAPDLAHKRVLGVLVNCDTRLLQGARRVLEVFPSEWEVAKAAHVDLVVGTRDYSGSAWFVPAGDGDVQAHGCASLPRDEHMWHELAALFVRHSLGWDPGGLSSYTRGNEEARIPIGMYSAMRLLQECIKTAGVGDAS